MYFLDFNLNRQDNDKMAWKVPIDNLNQDSLQTAICILKETMRRCAFNFKYVVLQKEHINEAYEKKPKSDFSTLAAKIESMPRFKEKSRIGSLLLELLKEDDVNKQKEIASLIKDSPRLGTTPVFYKCYEAIKKIDPELIDKELGSDLEPHRLFSIIPPLGNASILGFFGIKELKDKKYFISQFGDFKSPGMLKFYNNTFHAIMFTSTVILEQIDEADLDKKEQQIKNLGGVDSILSFAYNASDLIDKVIMNLHSARGFSYALIERSKTNVQSARSYTQKREKKIQKLVDLLTENALSINDNEIRITKKGLNKILIHGEVDADTDYKKKTYIKLVEEKLKKNVIVN